MSKKEPSIEQIMRCHRLMMDHLNNADFDSAYTGELDLLDQLCGPFDTHEILYDEIKKLNLCVGVMREALECFVNSVDHRAAIASYPMSMVDKARMALEDVTRIEK